MDNTEQISPNLPWQAQVGWIYAGHGEWSPRENGLRATEHGNKLEHEPQWIKQWLEKKDEDVQINQEVRHNGYPNRWGPGGQSSPGGT